MKQNCFLMIFFLLVSYGAYSQTYILREDFNNNSKNWAVKTHKDASMYLTSGHYYFSHKRKTGSWLSHRGVTTLKPYSDWEIEMRAKHVSGVDNYAFGLTFARKDNDNEYVFSISANGYYRITKEINGNNTKLVKWTKSSYINKGNHTYNTLKVKRKGSSWYFYINGNSVYSMGANSWPGKRVGFSVANKQAIQVDYLYVKQGTSSYANNNQNYNNNKRPYTNRNQNKGGKIVLYDDFYDNKNNWAVSYSGKKKMGVTGGHYYFERTPDSYSDVSTKYLRNFDSNGDWSVEAKIKHTSGIVNNGFGIVFGYKNNNHQVQYFLAANGYYLIKRMYGESLKTYLNTENSGSWTKSSLVKTGNYKYNTLKVEKRGSQWKFYLNGSLVETTRAYDWASNQVGFVVYKNQRMEVDYFSVKQLGGQQYVQNNKNYNNNNSYNAAPSITLYEPQTARGLNVVKAKTVRVAGKATDSDGIFEVKINGMDAKLLSDGYFSLDVPLAVGENSVTVIATDTRRKSKTQTFKIKREQSYNNVVNNNYNQNNYNQNNYNQGNNQRRLALLIGNSNYTSGGSLSNPVNDVRSMKTTLEQLGFTVLKYENCSQKDMRRAMDEFGQKLAGYDVGLFFYAGHGVQVEGNNYLVPTDAALKNKNDVEYDCVDAGRILGKMEASKVKTNIVILDACRDNPFERSWSRSAQGKGLAFMNAPTGSFIAYATSPGKTASDGIGSNGLYTAALLQHIKTPGLTIEDVFKRVRTTVKKKSGGKQVPWESTSLEGDFKFK